MKAMIILAALFLMVAPAMADHQVDNDLSSEWEATGFNNGRRMVRDSRGYFHMVYHSQTNPNGTPGGNCDIMYSHTLLPAPPTSSADWAPATEITFDTSLDDRYPSIAIEHGSPGNPTDNDMLHVVWQREDMSGVYQIMHSSNINSTMPAPGTWTPPFTVHVSAEHSLVPDVDCSLNNVVHVVWQEENFNSGLTSDILYSNSIDHGMNWTPFQNLSMTEFNSQTPDVATVIDFQEAPSNYTYYSERVHVVWSDDGPTSGPCIMYKSSPDAGNSWDLYENVSHSSGSMYSDGYPSLTVSREDIPHVAWMHGVIPHDPTDPGPYTPGVDPLNANSFPGPEVGMYSTILQNIYYSGRNSGNWGSFEIVDEAMAENEFPSIAVDNTDMLYVAWQANTYPATDYNIRQAERMVAGGGWGNATTFYHLDHDDLFPSEATKKTAMYSPGYDFVWTMIDSDLSATGHGQPAALSPAHEIWFSGNTQWNSSVSVEEEHIGITASAFDLMSNPVSSGTWISTGSEGGVISIIDICGRTVHTEAVPAGSAGIFWTVGEKLPEGVYRVVLRNEQEMQSKAVTVIR
ncbi:MAG: hypothetical protein KAR40_01070 [Candidatus Sabulitectum sp.]|nr:hypothetical protein [Candidatus Sabulitectum sp.]